MVGVVLGVSAFAKGLQSGKADGLAYYTKGLLDNLSRNDMLEGLVSYVEAGQLSSALQKPTFTVKTPYKIENLFDLRAQFGQLDSWLVQLNARVFHSPDHYIPRITKAPCLATVHDAIPVTNPELMRRWLAKLQARLFVRGVKRADHIVTVSDLSRRMIVQALDIDPDFISVVPNGIDSIWFDTPFLEGLCLRPKILGCEYVVCVGTVTHRKNFLGLARAFLKMPTASKVNRKLVIVGKNGWDSAGRELEKLVVEFEDRLVWFNDLSDIELVSVIDGSVGVALPSFIEGFGRPVIEACARGRPVLCSQNSSMSEILGSIAILVDPYSLDSMTQGLDHLFTTRYSTSDIEKVIDLSRRYTWSNVIDELNELYKRV